jgi:hypothetical protein
MSITYLICMTVVEAVIFFSLGFATADWRQQRAEWARQQQQETNERNTQ